MELLKMGLLRSTDIPYRVVIDFVCQTAGPNSSKAKPLRQFWMAESPAGFAI